MKSHVPYPTLTRIYIELIRPIEDRVIKITKVRFEYPGAGIQGRHDKADTIIMAIDHIGQEIALFIVVRAVLPHSSSRA